MRTGGSAIAVIPQSIKLEMKFMNGGNTANDQRP